MDKNQLLQEIDKAINTASKWATDGWEMLWGSSRTPVNSLDQAKKAPDSFVYKQESVTYWNDIKEMSAETILAAQKAKDAVSKNNISAAADAIYFARYIEKRFNKNTPTWGPLYDRLSSMQ